MPMFVDHSPPGECIFCKLVKGEIPSAKVYEDDLTIAFMDIGQATRGPTRFKGTITPLLLYKPPASMQQQWRSCMYWR